MFIDDLTIVEYRDGYYFKRDDCYFFGDAIGGKARVAKFLVDKAIRDGYTKIVTTGSRDSRQCDIVSCVCEDYGIDCYIFMPQGKDTPIIQKINTRKHTTIYRTKVGYNSVLISHSKKWAIENNAYYIPFGMESWDCIDINKHQVQNIPNDVSRIIIPCGGGMQMISVIRGLREYGKSHIKVIGVQVGANPKKIIEKFLKNDGLFGEPYNYEIVKSEIPYEKHLESCSFCGIHLDSVYESKCIPFLQKGDLLWIVGKNIT